MKNVALPAAQLPEAVIEKVKTLALQRSTSQAAIMRAAVVEFVAWVKENTLNGVANLVKQDYGKSIPFVNIYVSQEVKTELDRIASDFAVDRAQVVRAAVVRYLEGK